MNLLLSGKKEESQIAVRILVPGSRIFEILRLIAAGAADCTAKFPAIPVYRRNPVKESVYRLICSFTYWSSNI